MKVYFVFELKEEFVNLYKGNERVLYNILRQIYYLDTEEVEYGYNLFVQLTKPINKVILDRKIFLRYHQNIPYSKRKDVHYINNLYRNEISRLVVKRSYIRLELEQETSSFFDILKDFSDNYFVCCFKYQEYFFLSDKFSEVETFNSPIIHMWN